MGVVLGGGTNVPPDATNFAAVALGTGAQHAFGLRRNGTVLDWDGNSSLSYPTYNLTNIPPSATNIVSIAAGAYHCLALRADGTVLAWGNNSSGQTQIPSSATNVVAIAAGWYHTLVMRADGKLITWGTGYTPPTATNIVSFACGGNHSIALGADAKLYAWGESYQGQIAIPAWASNVVAVAGTRGNSLALVGERSPTISSPLVNRSALVGGKAYFYATAVGLWPLHYQWQFNGTDLVGATNQLLTILNVQPEQAGTYSVVVTNVLGTASSPGALLTVIPNESVIISQTVLVTNGQTSFLATSPAGLEWSVQASSNLVDWADLRTLTNTTGTMLFNEPATNASERFYRLRLVP